jgi:glycosyltransferase involved in cell wall biosynthesis
MRNSRTVDVVVPCYNYSRYLPGCVDSVLSQEGVQVRVLVIDDASTDETPQVARTLAAADSRVEYRRHEVNKGHIATYNEGLLEWSTADYAVLISADDMLAPGSLNRAAGLMESDRTIGMVYGSTIKFQHNAELPKVSNGKFSYTLFPGDHWVAARCRAGHNVISSPEVVVRGSIQRSVGGYRPELPHAGDLEMWLRIAAVSNIAYVRRVPQAFYRVHSASMLRTKYLNSLRDLNQRKAVFDMFFDEHPSIVDGTKLREMANRALAREALWDACRAYDRNDVEKVRAREFVDFALSTYAAATSLPEYAALLRRRRLGPVICNRTQLFAASALFRRAQRWVAKQRWQRRGI